MVLWRRELAEDFTIPDRVRGGPQCPGVLDLPGRAARRIHKSSGPGIFQVPLADFIREQAHWHVREGREEISLLWRELNHPGANHESPESTHADLEAGESEHPEEQHALRFSLRILLLLDALLPAARDGRCRQPRFAGNHNRLDDRAPGSDTRHRFRTVPGAIVGQLRDRQTPVESRHRPQLGAAGFHAAE